MDSNSASMPVSSFTSRIAASFMSSPEIIPTQSVQNQYSSESGQFYDYIGIMIFSHVGIILTSFNVPSREFPVLHFCMFLSDYQELVLLVQHNATNTKVCVACWGQISSTVLWEPFIHHHKVISGMVEVKSFLKSES